MRKIIVDPLMFPWAETFFLKGLTKIVGQEFLFDNKMFNGIFDNNRGVHTFNFILEDEGETTKFAIDWFDSNNINSKGAYDWCDVYGKVNTNWKVTPKNLFPKIISLGPSMGINFYSLPQIITNFIEIVLKSKIIFSKKSIKYAHYYYREYRRAPLEWYNYQKEDVINGYVFFLSTLWYNAKWNNNDDNLNTPRYQMMLACKSAPNITFEGGFVAHNSRNNKNGYISSIDSYSDCICKNRLSIDEYITKLKQSMVAINMPAVVSCHGWKLAEYLALGKCIVSLPLVNDLPFPLVHGENIHFINSPDEVRDALIYIYENPEYRRKLERGARQYYLNWCSPESAMRLLGI